MARLGGDEFVVLCEDLEDDRAAIRVAERVLAALDRPVPCGDTDVVISASIGISLTRRSDVTPDALLRDADMAMYRAKETGRHRIELFDNSARLRSQARIQNTNIDGYMPKAISKDGGRTWIVSKTPFPALSSNQRPDSSAPEEWAPLFRR